MTKKEIKEKIWKYEYCHSGFNKLSGVDVKVVNLRVRKNKAIADIVLTSDLESGNSERYNNCEYPFSLIK